MITEEYVPFHKVIKLLEDFANRHYDINGFGFGNLLEYGKDIEDKTFLYPVLFVVPQSITYDEQQTTYSISVIFADRLSEDLHNRVDAISNMSMVAKDLIGEIKLGDLQEYFDTEIPLTSTSFIERMEDNVGGVALDINLTTIDPLNVCERFMEPVIYQPNTIENLFAWYDFQDTSTITLTGGTDISQVLDKSGNDYTLTPNVNVPTYQQVGSGNLSSFYAMYDVNGTALRHNLSTPVSLTDYTIFVVNDFEFGDGVRPSVSITSGDTLTDLTWLSTYGIGIRSISGTHQFYGGVQRQVLGASIDPSNNAFITTSKGEISVDVEGNLYGVDNYTTTATLTPLTFSATTFDNIWVGDVFTSYSVGDRNICEVIMYDRALTDDEYNGVVEYLKNKYRYNYWV